MRILVSGGVQRPDAHQRAGIHHYEHGRVSSIDLAKGDEVVVFDHVTAPDLCPEHLPSIVCTAAHVDAERITAPTKTDIVVWDRQAERVEKVISLPAFNDVHHVLREEGGQGRMWVSNTGLDQVLELDREGQLVQAFAVMGGDPWERFDPATDYRRVASTKPHTAHSNYVLRFEGGLWATRFKQRDCVRVDGEGRMPVDLQGCHDGVVLHDHVYFTTVDGHIVKTRPGLPQPAKVWNLNDIVPGIRKLGWCRGLVMLSEDEALVGFSRLRLTKWRENVAWAGGVSAVKALRHRPTRISHVDLKAGKVLRTHELEGLDAVFSIHVDA